MCLAIPYKVIEVQENNKAVIEIEGTQQYVGTFMVPDIKVGDYVLVYLGSAMAKISQDEAVEVMRLYQDMAQAEMV